MPPSGLPPSNGPEVTDLELTAGVWHTAAVVRNADWSGRHAESVTLDRVLLVGASLAGARLDALRLLDVRLIGCDLSNLVLTQPSLVRVELRDCRVTGLCLEGGQLQDVRFVSCSGEAVSMMELSAERLTLEDCRWPDADMRATKLAHLLVNRCRLPGSEWGRASLEVARFTASDLSAVKGASGLRGASMDAATLVPAAAGLVKALGITVREDELPNGPFGA
jgi:uncharacterized protein YjbI with pentapeptide repeats